MSAVTSSTSSTPEVDWRDLQFAVLIGVLYAPLKAAELLGDPAWNLDEATAVFLSALCIAYILVRAEREPEKLRQWGLTTPITPGAIAFFLVFLAVPIVMLGVIGLRLTGTLSFEVSYVSRMVNYLPGAFPQQFLVFAVGLSNLERLPSLRGLWRLPLLVGSLFALGHFWSPTHLPGSFVPIQLLSTFPMGFGCAFFFLRFRTIVPLIAWHAVMFVLYVHWVERHL